MDFRLAPSHLTLDDLERSKTKVTVFDVKYVVNGLSYDVGPNRGYIDSSSMDLSQKSVAFLLILVFVNFLLLFGYVRQTKLAMRLCLSARSYSFIVMLSL